MFLSSKSPSLRICSLAVYLTAFATFFIQISGLYGSDGILPAASFMDRVEEHSPNKFHVLPNILWVTKPLNDVVVSLFPQLGDFDHYENMLHIVKPDCSCVKCSLVDFLLDFLAECSCCCWDSFAKEVNVDDELPVIFLYVVQLFILGEHWPNFHVIPMGHLSP